MSGHYGTSPEEFKQVTPGFTVTITTKYHPDTSDWAHGIEFAEHFMSAACATLNNRMWGPAGMPGGQWRWEPGVVEPEKGRDVN